MQDGTLLHIPNFIFENGTSKNKFFLVIKQIENTQLIVSLPSSVDHLPTDTEINHGCIELPEAQQTTYCFLSGNVLDDDSGFSFNKNTFLYGYWLKDIDKTKFYEEYPLEGFHYEIKAVLNSQELSNVINCFKNSASVSRKFKRLL